MRSRTAAAIGDRAELPGPCFGEAGREIVMPVDELIQGCRRRSVRDGSLRLGRQRHG
jgi:hypothetical protein